MRKKKREEGQRLEEKEERERERERGDLILVDTNISYFENISSTSGNMV